MRLLIFIFTLWFSINAYALKDCSSFFSSKNWHNCEGTLTHPDQPDPIRGYFINGEPIILICSDMGFSEGTKAFGDCVLKLIDKIN